MRAITLWQPWASLVAIRAKGYETRSWSTPYRGSLAIHAALRPLDKTLSSISTQALESMAKALDEAGLRFGLLPLGAVVATCRLANVFSVEDLWPMIKELGDEYLFGDFSEGRFAWQLDSVRELDSPITVAGKQGLWNWQLP
jgi:hypothetical protein